MISTKKNFELKTNFLNFTKISRIDHIWKKFRAKLSNFAIYHDVLRSRYFIAIFNFRMIEKAMYTWMNKHFIAHDLKYYKSFSNDFS